MAFRCGAFFVTEVSYFALRTITARVFPFFVAEDHCALDANFPPCVPLHSLR